MAEKVTIQNLLEAGVHFGHQVKRWNPKMKEYVYGVKSGISIIDLTKTMRLLADACNYLQHNVNAGGELLFVGTKRQAQEIIKEAAEKCGMHYVSERWLGGTLTNNATIRKSIGRMREIDEIMSSQSERMSKKELSSLRRQSERLHRNLDGISNLKNLPSALIIVDVCNEDIAVREARKLKIPIVGIVDTNGDPEVVDYPIPANDDAIRSIKIIVDVIVGSVAVAADLYRKRWAEEQATAAAARAEAEKNGTAPAASDKPKRPSRERRDRRPGEGRGSRPSSAGSSADGAKRRSPASRRPATAAPAVKKPAAAKDVAAKEVPAVKEPAPKEVKKKPDEAPKETVVEAKPKKATKSAEEKKATHKSEAAAEAPKA